MKTKLLILLFLIASLGIVLPNNVVAQNQDAPSISNQELPSDSYLKKEKRSLATTTTSTSASAAAFTGISPAAAFGWDDPFFPGENENGGGNVVGGPIGDISLPVIFLLLAIYFVYRNVTTSRRRNNL